MLDCLSCCCFDNGYESSGDECEDESAKDLSYVGKRAYDVLRRKHNQYHHQCWNVTSGVLVGNLHQTPLDAWSRETDYPADGHNEWFPDKLAEIMKRTRIWCDVMSLQQPDGVFFAAIQEALEEIARNAEGKDQPVIVRMLFANIPACPTNCNLFIRKITQNIPKDANIRLWVGAWRRGLSWNHAKIIAVDGQHLWTGGHNFWDKHYLKKNPVHDLSFELEGRCANDGHRYANEQWLFIQLIQKYSLFGKIVDKLPDGLPLVVKTRVTVSEFPRGKATEFPPTYEKSMVPRRDPLDGEVLLITMGRYGSMLRWNRPSDDAFLAMFRAARTIIRMALQDLGPVCIPRTNIALPGLVWPHSTLNALAEVIWERGVHVEIALSNPGSIPGGLAITEACYGNGWSCVDVAAEIIVHIRKQYPDVSDSDLYRVMSEKLRLCYVRQARGNKYDDGLTIGMHAKHFIVDDCCTYIGSQNLYICDLAEWGVLVDDKAATKQIMDEYWNPMWKSSYTEEDCDVREVMKALGVERDGEKITPFQKLQQGTFDSIEDAEGDGYNASMARLGVGRISARRSSLVRRDGTIPQGTRDEYNDEGDGDSNNGTILVKRERIITQGREGKHENDDDDDDYFCCCCCCCGWCLEDDFFS